MRPTRFDPIGRIGIRPDEPDALAPRKPGTRRPHGDARVAAVRRLIEQTALTYGEIAARTGVGRASICRWTRDGGWVRPITAPVATDRVPSARASAKLKRRTLADRLSALAERMVREMEAAPAVDPDALAGALEVLKMARLEAMGRRRRRGFVGETTTGAQWLGRQEAVRRALRELRRGGVDVDRAPDTALGMVLEAALPPEDHPALRPRGRR